MFEDITVVPSAVSAFNNAALAAPAFLWNALLCAPLFIAAYLISRSPWAKSVLDKWVSVSCISFWTVVISAVWLVLMGGNYGVLRDGVSWLPVLSAGFLFLACVLIGFKTKDVKLPLWYGDTSVSYRKRWWVNILVMCLVLVPVALSDTLNWWGPILQVFAVLFGCFVGRYRWNRDVPSLFMMAGTLIITTAILMQPEYFRFGQLGNLTPWHILWVMATGFVIAICCALTFVRPRSRIHTSAFVKIKWFLRLMALLAAVLFALTEAVPIFLAMTLMVFLLCGISVWHSDKTPSGLNDKFLSVLVMLFGVLISVPTITILGVVLMTFLPKEPRLDTGKYLL